MSHAPAPTAAPLIGFGQVRHTRLRPRRHAFAYPTFFLMLPMRNLSEADSPLAVNRSGAISFHDMDHGDGRSAAQGGALAWLDVANRLLRSRDKAKVELAEASAVQEGIPYVPAEFFTEFLNEVEYGEGIVTIAPSVVGLDDIGDFLAGLH